MASRCSGARLAAPSEGGPRQAAMASSSLPASSASVGSVKWVPSGKTTTGIWVRPLIALARSAPSKTT